MLSPVTVQNQNGHFSVIICKKKGATFLLCVLHKLSSLYAPSEIASQFPPPLRSNNTESFSAKTETLSAKTVLFPQHAF
jgi:hypothetical protein